MAFDNKLMGIVRQPSREIAAKLILNLSAELDEIAGRLSQLLRKPLTCADLIELKQLKNRAKKLSEAKRIYLSV